MKFILGCGGFFLAFVVWAWFSHVDQIGEAQGKLIPQGETYKLETVQMGKIKRIAVKEGELVQTGQIIAELDTHLAQSEVDRLQQQLEAQRQELLQKEALFQQVTLELQAQAKMVATEVMGHHHAIESAQNQAYVLKDLILRRQKEKNALHQRQTRLVSLHDLSDARARELAAEIESHQERIQRLTRLESQGAISKEALFLADQGLRQTQKQFTESKLNRVSSVNEQIFQAEQALRSLDADLLQRQGELAAALKEIQKLNVNLELKEGDVLRQELEAKQTLNLLLQEMTRIQAQIDETQTLLEASVVKLEQNFLKAPVSGVVLLSYLKNIGKVIQPGQTIAEIAPQSSPLIIKARLPNQDAGFVEIDMPVQIKMDAYPFQEYGVIPGKVMSISADSVADEQMGQVYLVDIALERNYVIENHQKIYFKPGQTAAASIQIRQRRILDMLLDPIQKLR